MRILIPLLLLPVLLLQACSKELSADAGTPGTAKVQLRFTHTVNGQPLQAGSTYTNNFGEPFSIARFKYYVSNLQLHTGSRQVAAGGQYYLVDIATDTSTVIEVPVQPGTYSSLSLLLGVDSARNVSGAQTGALDPVQDMFWTWNTGYIMFKLEGNSPSSGAPNNRIQYHIGGFAGPHHALRNLEVRFNSPLALQDAQTLTIDLNAELLRWFNGRHDLPISAHAVAMTPDALASQYADNALSMFTVTDASVQ